jgi:hypothetical protein
VAKILYPAKRVKPECLTVVVFLSTKVTMSDIDDLTKLRRLLGYIRHTRTRGIVLRVGRTCTMMVKAYIDAAYGVHQDSGKSHTGCAIVHEESGPVFAKSSTEAELVGLSETASQAIHLRKLIIAQGYDIVLVYQDNMSCMALIKRGGPGSERSRHMWARMAEEGRKEGRKGKAVIGLAVGRVLRPECRKSENTAWERWDCIIIS